MSRRASVSASEQVAGASSGHQESPGSAVRESSVATRSDWLNAAWLIDGPGGPGLPKQSGRRSFSI